MNSPRVTYVIMAGGKGERLWPLVRTSLPKVCVPLEDGRPLLQATLERLGPLVRHRDVLIVTVADQAKAVRAVLPPSRRRALLVEPEGKNTAACLALATAALRRDPDRLMVVLPADHWIRPAEAFRRTLQAGMAVAQEQDELVLIGITPTRAHPGLGHLVVEPPVGTRHGCRLFRLARFIEKPPRKVARRLLRARTAYWNAGIFIGRVRVFEEAFRRYLPLHARRLFSRGATAHLRSAYRGLPAVSFDNGVMALGQGGWVVEGRFAWEDLGSWDSWIRLNRLSPPLLVNGSNVHALTRDGHLIAAVGLRDAVIIQTPDATLICRTQEAQHIRDVVRMLQRDARFARYR